MSEGDNQRKKRSVLMAGGKHQGQPDVRPRRRVSGGAFTPAGTVDPGGKLSGATATNKVRQTYRIPKGRQDG
jgi:hypothetical protein